MDTHEAVHVAGRYLTTSKAAKESTSVSFIFIFIFIFSFKGEEVG